jgi:hypothetical protein
MASPERFVGDIANDKFDAERMVKCGVFVSPAEGDGVPIDT